MIGTIMLVDDEDSLRVILTDLFEEQGYEVVAVPSGREALELLNSGSCNPNVIISDVINYAGMDGIQFMTALHKFYPGPVICYTGMSDKQTLAQCLKVGVRVFVAKPCEFEALHSVVRIILMSFAQKVARN